MHVQRIKKGAENTTLRCSCVQGQGGRSDGPHPHHLAADRQEIHDETAYVGVKPRLLRLEISPEGIIVLNTEL